MKFILELWPDVESDDPQVLLADAVESIRTNPQFRWSIADDDGKVIHANVVLSMHVQ